MIAEDVVGEALATLVLSTLRGMLNVVAIKAPGFGDRRKAMLRDICTLSGGSVITEEEGRKLDGVQIEVKIKNPTSDYDNEKLQERLAKLSGGVAIIRVGAAPETELKKTNHRGEGAPSNAVSLGAMILSTEALVTDIPEEKPATPAGGMPDH